jgi:microcystin-dependent protein
VAEPFLAEIRLMSFNFAPKGWAQCNGQLLPINQNQPIFSLLGTTYGGDGRVNFALPDLRSRVPIHMGSGFTLGQKGGEEAHVLTVQELPQHLHQASASSSTGNAAPVAGNILASSPALVYAPSNPSTTLQAATLANVGGSQAHTNLQPILTLNFCIALQGIFPSQT